VVSGTAYSNEWSAREQPQIGGVQIAQRVRIAEETVEQAGVVVLPGSESLCIPHGQVGLDRAELVEALFDFGFGAFCRSASASLRVLETLERALPLPGWRQAHVATRVAAVRTGRTTARSVDASTPQQALRN
jgi:hypothetical protein